MTLGTRPEIAIAPDAFRTRFFYHEGYVYDVLEAGRRHTFDIERPRRIRDALVATRLVGPSDFIAAPPASESEMLLVHTPEHLAQIHRPETLAKLLLLDPAHPWGDRLLDPFLLAAGGTIAAARAAATERVVAINLGGGFHHAQADKAEGFCAIADVAIAIRALRQHDLATRVLIVDLDCHHGNGNAEIFANDETVFTLSIHGNNWCWITKHNNRDVNLPSHAGDDTYLAAVRTHVPAVVREFEPDLTFYIAGSDPFIEDALGDFDVSEAGMLERDQIVTAALRERDIPMVVTTAGGYGPSSWRIHFNYFRWLLGGQAGG